MSTVSPLATKKVLRCFFFSLAFVIVIPIVSIVLGVTQHPAEFSYELPQINDTVPRTVYLHADLISADLKQGTMVLDWSIIFDTCDPESASCTNVNIFFDANLLQQTETNSTESSDNNLPTVPTFIWNFTTSDDILSNSPRFQTDLFVFRNYSFDIHSVKHTHSSDVYFTEVFTFATDATTNEMVPLSLFSTAGLVESGLITLTICLLMIMTVAFGFQRRNEIVVVPIGVVFAFIQLRSTMPGAPDGFGDILDFVGVLPCLVLLSICAVTMVGIYIFTDPAKDSREKFTWSVLVALCEQALPQCKLSIAVGKPT
ncbi:hypothetical protein ARMGADRAFT_1034211 [Armillaria gallica]|uniref:Uncharacterized protein n=1 Tax=Armillaria gallica TaxID=47427 RepID=A0A2H3DBK2_ARMGA|nr:hypothetical protein ARMGADRAFT_1034211 [Armillaria gallica]